MAPQTGFAPLDWFLALLDTWGHLIVIGFTISENLFVLGSFTPGETVVMAAGFVSEGGGLNPWLVGVSSLIGTLTGSNLSYWFGRRGGRQALLRWGGKFFDEERIIAAEEYFELHGNKTVLVSRFAAGFKNFVPVIAGASRMRLWIFELYTFIGALIYTTLMVMLGRIFAENFDKALAIARNLTWVGFAVLVAMIAFLLWGRHKIISRKVDLLVEVAELEDEAARSDAGSAGPGGDAHETGDEHHDDRDLP
ncbi:MAG: DedA family protein [Coriobacteriia bacterium]|nr:DedA family protein [Coriobacteriia bacterium]